MSPSDLGMLVARNSMMRIAAGSSASQAETTDIFFKCAHCETPLVVDAKAAGMTVSCQSCGKPTCVPARSVNDDKDHRSPTAAATKMAELQRHLKENESQRTEINGYINQINIQLHRWQLRLQALNERNKQLTSEIWALSRADDSKSPN
jgi:transcription elongation factor Elf1